jgi:hypothetical protein
MADKEGWVGKGTFPRLFIYLCILVNLLGIAALLILIVTEFVILVNNYQSYVARYGYHYGEFPSSLRCCVTDKTWADVKQRTDI